MFSKGSFPTRGRRKVSLCGNGLNCSSPEQILKQNYNRNKQWTLLTTKIIIILQTALDSLKNNKIPHRSKFKAIADFEKILVKIMKFVFKKIESIVGRGEDTGFKATNYFSHMLQRTESSPQPGIKLQGDPKKMRPMNMLIKTLIFRL